MDVSPNLTIHRNKWGPSHKILWEVVLYQKPRWQTCFCNRFLTKGEALRYARLNLSNPQWSEIVVHPIIKEYATHLYYNRA